MSARHSKAGTIAANIAGVIVFVVMAFPVYWMINTSLKPKSDIFTSTPKFLPIPLTFDNYSNVVGNQGFFTFARNSLIVTVVVVVVSMLVAFLAATAVARFNFSGRKSYVILILAGMSLVVRSLGAAA